MLTQRQLQSYWADGFIVLPELIDKTAIAEMRRVTDRFVEESRNVSQHTDVFDLEPDHSSERPRLRRLKNPHKLHDSYRNVLWHEGITSVMRQILGDSFRLHGGVQKINMKLAGDGAPSIGTRTGPSIRTPTTTCWPWESFWTMSMKPTVRCWPSPVRIGGRFMITLPTVRSAARSTRTRQALTWQTRYR